MKNLKSIFVFALTCLIVELMLILNTEQVDIKLTTSMVSWPIKSSKGLIITPPPRPTKAPKKVAVIIISE